MPGKANSEDDQGAATAAPADPKSDLTVAKVDGQGRVIIPAGVLTLRDPRDLSVTAVMQTQRPAVDDVLFGLGNLLQALNTLKPNASVPVDLTRFRIDRDLLQRLLEGFKLDDGINQLALSQEKGIPQSLAVVFKNQNGDQLHQLMFFIAFLAGNQGTLSNNGKSITASAQGQQFELPLEVLNLLLGQRLPSSQVPPLKEAFENAIVALQDLTQEAVVARIDYTRCTHLAQAATVNPLLLVSLGLLPAPVLELLVRLNPGQTQEVFKLDAMMQILLDKFNITGASDQEKIAQLEGISRLVEGYRQNQGQQQQLAQLLGSDQNQTALGLIASGPPQSENLEQRLLISSTMFAGMIEQLRNPKIPLSFFVTKDAQGNPSYGYAANNNPAEIKKGVFQAINRNMLQKLTDEQKGLLDAIGQVQRRLALTQPGQPQPTQQPQTEQAGRISWFYANMPSRQTVLTEVLKKVMGK